jgi:hypothetical protein
VKNSAVRIDTCNTNAITTTMPSKLLCMVAPSPARGKKSVEH